MSRVSPQVQATPFQPGIQRLKIWEVWHALQYLVARIPNVLLDLALLPTCRRIAELGLIDIVVRHREKAHVDLSLLAATYTIHRRLHVVVDTPSGDAAKDPEPVPMGIEQHLVGLQRIFVGVDSVSIRKRLNISGIVRSGRDRLPWATPDTIATIIGLITPVLVWAIPNKKFV